ncbi:MAG: sialidase family protein [Smithella sp.]|jgi:predicted neuraminidase
MNNLRDHLAGMVVLVLNIIFLTMVIIGCGASGSEDSSSDVSYEFNVSDSPATVTSGDEPLMEEEAVFEQIPGMVGHHAATLTIFADGEMLAGWYSYSGDHELSGSAIYLSRKKPGQSWESPQLHIDRFTGDGNPVLYNEDDHVWLFQAAVPGGWDTSHIEVQESTDRGASWTDPVVLGPELGPNVKYPPVRLNDGTLLLPAYSELSDKAIFFESTDGTNWSQRSSVKSNPGNSQPSFVQLSTGRLISVMRNEDMGCLWVTASDNNGELWSEPKDSGFLNPASATQMIRLANGHLVLIYNDSDTQRRPLSIALSADEGRTWPYRKVLKDGADTYSYPFAVQGPDGIIHVLYSLNRDKIMHIAVNEAWIILSSYIF